MKQPLEGIRVLELGMFHAGPGGSAILGDLGAEVIKIEQPGTGDPMRHMKMVGSVPLKIQGENSIWHEAANRNKKSITIDLNKEKGKEVAYRLASKSDVFLTSLRRPAVEKLKMDYPVLSKINPKIIYAWVSGYGPNGPDRDVGAFDYQGQGRSGMMFCVGEPDMPPLVSQFGIIDQATSIMASHEVITALLMRERFGIGQEVHVSILSTALYLLYCNVLIALVGDFEVPRHQRIKEYPLRNYYKCADDRWFILTATLFDRYWPGLCQAIGHPGLEKDARFDTQEKLHANSEQFVALLDRIFATRSRDEWLDIFAKYDLPVGPVNRLSELVSDPQITENGYIVDFEHPRLGKIKIPGYPVHFSKTYARTRSAAPELGEHTDSVLREIGGYSAKEIAQLRDEGVI
ncbi:MAG: CoA transferase [Chloroflexi bacterium]|nr:CoA transferase [Chloroflexota bacterium]